MTDDLRDEFTDWLDEQSVERIQVAMERTLRRCDEDDDEFETILHEEVWKLYNQDCLSGLVDKGLAEATVMEDGQLGYRLTQDGRDVAEEIVRREGR